VERHPLDRHCRKALVATAPQVEAGVGHVRGAAPEGSGNGNPETARSMARAFHGCASCVSHVHVCASCACPCTRARARV
jgi:hypothetical protein